MNRIKICAASTAEHAAAIKSHIIHMSASDKYLRFGYAAPDEQISVYIDNTFKNINSVWLIAKQNSQVVGTLHIAFSGLMAEFGLTVDSKLRNSGIGKSLFAQAYLMCIQQEIQQINLYCLSQNTAIKKIAVSFGLQIINCGPDAEAAVIIKYPVTAEEVKRIVSFFTVDDQFTNILNCHIINCHQTKNKNK